MAGGMEDWRAGGVVGRRAEGSGGPLVLVDTQGRARGDISNVRHVLPSIKTINQVAPRAVTTGALCSWRPCPPHPAPPRPPVKTNDISLRLSSWEVDLAFLLFLWAYERNVCCSCVVVQGHAEPGRAGVAGRWPGLGVA